MTNMQEMISVAKKDAENETDFKKEVFLASLLKQMLQRGEHQEVNYEKTPETHSLKRQAIKEFILQKKPDSDVEKVLLMGYFLEKQEASECFNVDDIKEAYIKAKEPIPTNINDKINMNIRKGLITELPKKKDNKKAYQVTSTGEQTVENWSKNE